MEMLQGGPSPRVNLRTRRKEPDYAWIPECKMSMNAVPSVVLEVAVFHETAQELLEEGSEWLEMPQTQVKILFAHRASQMAFTSMLLGLQFAPSSLRK